LFEVNPMNRDAFKTVSDMNGTPPCGARTRAGDPAKRLRCPMGNAASTVGSVPARPVALPMAGTGTDIGRARLSRNANSFDCKGTLGTSHEQI
jgi:hypothetical protein